MSDPNAGNGAWHGHPGPLPPGPPPMSAYAGVGERLVGRIIDAVVVGIPTNIVIGVLPGIALGDDLAYVVSAVVSFGYFVMLESSQGATVGKLLLRLRVTDAAGATPISMAASAQRNWWILLGVLTGISFVGFLAGIASLVIVILIATTIGSDQRNQGWHDKMAGTLVVKRAA